MTITDTFAKYRREGKVDTHCQQAMMEASVIESEELTFVKAITGTEKPIKQLDMLDVNVVKDHLLLDFPEVIRSIAPSQYKTAREMGYDWRGNLRADHLPFCGIFYVDCLLRIQELATGEKVRGGAR
jgi:hypothetical protein